MSRIVYARRALKDVDRLAEFITEADPSAAAETIAIIRDGISIVERYPLIGRPAELGLRELVISRGRSGYVALYRYDIARDEVMVLGIRHQREAGSD